MQLKKSWSAPKLDQLVISETLSGDILTVSESVLTVNIPGFGVIGDPTGPNS